MDDRDSECSSMFSMAEVSWLISKGEAEVEETEEEDEDDEEEEANSAEIMVASA